MAITRIQTAIENAWNHMDIKELNKLLTWVDNNCPEGASCPIDKELLANAHSLCDTVACGKNNVVYF